MAMAQMAIPRPGFPNINIVAYLTAPGIPIPPRLTSSDLEKFLTILARSPYLFRALDDDWISVVGRVAFDAAMSLSNHSETLYEPEGSVVDHRSRPDLRRR